MKINSVLYNVQKISFTVISVSSSVSLSPASQCRYLTLDGLKHTNHSKQQLYKITQYTINTRNTIQSTHARMPTHSKKSRQQCALPPGPAQDLGSSLLTPTVVVALALGTSSPGPERTPLTRQPAAIFRTGSSVELSSTPRLYKDGHPRYQSVLNV